MNEKFKPNQPVPGVSESYINEICQFLEISADRYEASFVEKALQKRMVETQCRSVESYRELLISCKEEEQALELLLQNSYSEFFRNPLTFSVLEKIVFPSLAANKRSEGKELRIWSAACASGQEPYSLAMLLEENRNNNVEPIRYRIFATDKSKSQIEHAHLGYYTSLSMGQVSLKRLSRWFDIKTIDSRKSSYCIKNELKRNIDFSVFDLLDEHASVPPSSIFGHFDVVICANLLFYYKPVYREKILNKITNSLSINGVLIAGETERELLIQKGFSEVFYRTGIFRR